MMTRTQAEEILEALSVLPPEKVAEVYDLRFFCRSAMANVQPWT